MIPGLGMKRHVGSGNLMQLEIRPVLEDQPLAEVLQRTGAA
jgi:hypothetical protein